MFFSPKYTLIFNLFDHCLDINCDVASDTYKRVTLYSEIARVINHLAITHTHTHTDTRLFVFP